MNFKKYLLGSLVFISSCGSIKNSVRSIEPYVPIYPLAYEVSNIRGLNSQTIDFKNYPNINPKKSFSLLTSRCGIFDEATEFYTSGENKALDSVRVFSYYSPGSKVYKKNNAEDTFMIEEFQEDFDNYLKIIEEFKFGRGLAF